MSDRVYKPHGVRYPWDDWFKRGTFTLVRNVDYASKTYGMMHTARNEASKRGLSLSIEVWDDESGMTVTVNTEPSDGKAVNGVPGDRPRKRGRDGVDRTKSDQ